MKIACTALGGTRFLCQGERVPEKDFFWGICLTGDSKVFIVE